MTRTNPADQMTKRRWWPVLALLAFSACERASPEGEPVSRSPEQMARIADDSVRAIVSGTPAGLATPDTVGTGDARSFNLAPVGASGVAAEAIVAPLGEQTQVVVQIERVPAGTALDASVRRGTCESVGPAIDPVEVTQYVGDGPRVARVLVPTNPEVLLGGGYSVHLGPPDVTPAVSYACAVIPSARPV